MTIHYVAMTGMHGCIPNFCCSCETRESAVDELTFLCELEESQASELAEDGIIEIGDRNEYCEITECDCNDPDCHNDV